MKNPKRTTLLINLSVEEAEEIRAAAKKQDRTISAFILRAVMNRIRIERQVENRQQFYENYMDRARPTLTSWQTHAEPRRPENRSL